VIEVDEKLKIFYDLFDRRRSVREFDDREIEHDKLKRILERLRRAQSAANRQPWHFVLLERKGREEFNALLTREGFKNAPLIIVACAEPERAWVRKSDGKNYAWVDVTIALTEMVGAATAEGLGTCWIASIDPETIRNVLSIPGDMEIVGLIVMGYPKTPLDKVDKDRKTLEEIIHYGRW
jgi:nitroreductase